MQKSLLAQDLIAVEMIKNKPHKRIGAAAERSPRLGKQQRFPVTRTAVHRCFRKFLATNLDTIPARAFFFRSDSGLIAAGIVAAVSSVAFATFMISQSSGPDMAEKTEYPGFFARGLLRKSYKSLVPANKSANRPIAFRDIDYDVTGSISRHGVGANAQNSLPASAIGESPAYASASMNNTYVLRFVHRGAALLQSKRCFYVVRRGTVLPGAGKVLSIERFGKTWIVATATRTFTSGSKNIP